LFLYFGILDKKSAKMTKLEGNTNYAWKSHIHRIIFEADTPWGKTFDIVLLLAIMASVLVVAIESVDSIQIRYGPLLKGLEWGFTIIFTIEYLLRIISLKYPRYYIFSFFGIVDFLSIIPTYLSIIIAGSQALLVIRILRLLRIFRVLKLVRYLGEAHTLFYALRNSIPKIIVFLVAVFTITIIMGTVMYIVEGTENGFTSIPRSIYWCIVTLTTVGYGDIAPNTTLGQTIASFIMIMGYGIIAVPTGIVTSELTKSKNMINVNNHACKSCGGEGHDPDAKHCKHCGHVL
jgi:voltage-gated potassium channel